ncbi:MAG: glycosyltransferase [Actinomycetota bacterium]
MKKIRVLRIIARMNVGGPALQVTVLAEGLNPSRFESRVLVGNVGKGEGDYVDLRAPKAPVRRVPGLGRAVNFLGDVRAFATIVGEIRRFRPHIVHTHTAKAGALGRVAAILTRVPATVHTFHGHLLRGYFSPMLTRCVVHSERALARGTTRLVAVGRQVRDELLGAGIGSRDQYAVVPPGVGLRPTPERGSARALLDLPPDCPVVAYVARLAAVKRPDRFIDVAKRLAAYRPNSIFLVAGAGELLDDMRARARPLDSRIRFLGWRSDVENVYAASDVVVLTSDNEGMPVSLIEAAVAGRPAVSVRAGSAPEVVVDGVTGVITDASADDIAGAVEMLLSDRDLSNRMGAAAAERARREFSATRLVADTERLYEEIAEQKGFA